MFKRQRCAHCGALYSRELSMCPLCGHSQTVKSASTVCPECGASLPARQRTCPYCGATREVPAVGLVAIAARAAASLAVLAVGALLIWWILPLGLTDEESLGSTPATASVTVTLGESAVAAVLAVTETPAQVSTVVPDQSETAEATDAAEAEQPVPTETENPSEEATAEATPEVSTYTVAQGDVPGAIASRLGVTLDALLQINGLTESSILQIGQVLQVPTAESEVAVSEPTPEAEPVGTPFVHVVAAGDTLGGLAVRYQVDSAEIAEMNSISVNSVLRIGQELIIPGTALTEPATATPAPTETPTVAPTATSTVTATPVPSASPTAVRTPSVRTTAVVVPSTTVGTRQSATPTASPTVTPTATATPTPAPTLRVHVVQAGEHIGIIAGIYDVSMSEIARVNGIGVDDILSVGQELLIPGPEGAVAPPTETPGTDATPSEDGTPAATLETQATPAPQIHVIQQGDTLGGLAVRYDVDSQLIAQANGLSMYSVLTIGQELVIPGVTPQPTVAPTDAAAAAVPTVVSSATPTVFPYRTRQVQMPYRQPRLLMPVNSAVFEEEDDLPILQWTSVGILGANEWYQVRLWTPDGGADPQLYRTRSTSWRLDSSMYPKTSRGDRFLWDVAVVSLMDTAPGYTELSIVSVQRSFRWR